MRGIIAFKDRVWARRAWSTRRGTHAAGPDSFNRAIVIFLKEKSGIGLTNCTA